MSRSATGRQRCVSSSRNNEPDLIAPDRTATIQSDKFVMLRSRPSTPITRYAMPVDDPARAITPERFQTLAIPVLPRRRRILTHVQRLAFSNVTWMLSQNEFTPAG